MSRRAMAVVVGAVHVSVAELTTLMANADDFFSNAFPQTFIENKVFSDKL